MALGKGKEDILELCSRATTLGNSISIRMLQYLSVVKTQSPDFRALAAEFLDTCRILWSVEAGLVESSKNRNKFPMDMVKELEVKFRQTIDCFLVLDQVILKYLESEGKGTFGKLQRSLRKMFSGTDLDKLRAELVKCRDALRMSSMVFRWAIGDDKADAAPGIGYTGLLAAVERMDRDRATTTIPPPSVIRSPNSSGQATSNAQRVVTQPAGQETRSTSSSIDAMALSPMLPAPGLTRQASITTNSASIKSTPHSPTTEYLLPHEFLKEGTTREPKVVSEDDPISAFKFPKTFVRVTADPSTVPRWTPRGTYAITSVASKAALATAVELKDHKTLEKLLDSGVGANGELDSAVLNAACQAGDTESVRLLLLFGGDANALDKQRVAPLMAATQANFVAGAKLLLKYGADPNACTGTDGISALAAAVREGNIELVHQYLMYGGDANARMTNGNTVLNLAMTQTTAAKIVELILKYGGDINYKNREGQTALFAALQTGRADLVALLLDNGANPNLPAPKHPLWPCANQPRLLELMLAKGADPLKTPGIMELATSNNNIDAVKTLLKHGASPNVKKDGIWTPLCTSIRDDNEDIFNLLLASGADPNLPSAEYPAFKCVTHNRVKYLPRLIAAGNDLHNPKGIIETAVACDNREALLFLLEEGVDPNVRTDEGHTALTTAIRLGHAEFVDTLLARGANPGIRGEDWPISMAVKHPHILQKLIAVSSKSSMANGVIELAVSANELQSIKILLRAGVSVEDKTGGVFSPLTTAIREHKTEIVRYLLDEAGADPNRPGEHLPIIKAIRRCRGNDHEIIEMLLAKGADINKMYRGWNAVLQAVENGDAEILRLLIAKGGAVDLLVQDEDGKSVIDRVTERGWDEAIAILLGSAQQESSMLSNVHMPRESLSVYHGPLVL